MYKPLTNRQIEILHLWVRGHNQPQIAEALGIGVRTVETHKENILKNFGKKNIFELLIATKVIDLEKLPI